MRKPVDDAVDTVEFRRYYIKVLGILCVISSKDRVGHMIGKLHDTGRARINEQRCINEIVNLSPLSAKYTEVARHLLQGLFMGTFIENQKSPLTIALVTKTTKIKIKTATNILKGQFHWILVGVGFFMNRARKRPGGVIGLAQDSKDGFNYSLGFFTFHIAPNAILSPAKNFGCVKFNAIRITGTNALSKLVEFLRDPVGLRFKYGHAT